MLDIRQWILHLVGKEDVRGWLTLSKGCFPQIVAVLYRRITLKHHLDMCATMPALVSTDGPVNVCTCH
jgi:hypothetical protein